MLRQSGLLMIAMLAAAGAYADKPRFGDTLSFALGGMHHRGEAVFSSTPTGEEEDRLSMRDLGLDERELAAPCDPAARVGAFATSVAVLRGDG